MEVIQVDMSWWSTRQKHGVHVQYTSHEHLEYAKALSIGLGTNTVYCYKL